MSGSGGGDRKKRTWRGAGWEEAGGEFYQESYPGGDADMEALQRDPHHLATLLPSKQNRNATTKHPRRDSRASLKRRTSTRSRYQTTTVRQSTTHINDIQLSMMPDLSENLSNEERMWEEIMLIKSMPISMAQKKEMKAQLQSADTFRLQGLKQFKWQRRKMWEQLKMQWKETYSKLELWKHSLKKIEGNFGTGVVAFFLFVKWLMLLNLTISAMIVVFVVMPTVMLPPQHHDTTEPCTVILSDNDTTDGQSLFCCSTSYKLVRNRTENETFIDFVQGTGWMESTYVFYGVYPDKILLNDIVNYNLPLAYIGVALCYFLYSLASILKGSARGFKERLIEGEGQFYHYCNIVFAGWDFCIQNERSSVIKHKALYNEIKGSLEAERRADEKRNRSREERFKILMVRVIVNCLVILTLILAGILIFFAFSYSRSELERTELLVEPVPRYYSLLLEFAPSMCIVSLNLVVPTIFNYLVSFEQYNPIYVVRLTLLRTVLLRLSSLGVLVASFYPLLKCQIHSSDCFEESACESTPCWEVYIGQHMYKLLILDTVSSVLITFVLNFPRMLMAKHINCRLARFLGKQEFELPKHVLDVVYTQTLSWFGSFYAPLLPVFTTLVFFVVFNVKKFACLVNSTPSSTIYRASRSNSMFMSVLLVSLAVAVIPWAFSISEMMPSKTCGPFRGRRSAWTVMEATFHTFPTWVKVTADFCTTAAFAVPLFVVLVLSLYYYYAVAAANKHMVAVLKKQLVLEGHDKQFLLNRLSAFIKQQQERHKAAARSVDLPNS
ncbi:transmembrane channel-like protein 7 [Nilaparvata lugens]|uniref:transmembrane channel-like protein 7 n=1 Tax=Nilaparvata lugens TaxID=108931 RepID=UPI000B985758|nr:transmembrane channel-like protein 7 [Nilaparvata lugens]